MNDADLRQLDLLAVDCQTTGATPDHGRIVEIGWARIDGSSAETGGGGDGDASGSELVALEGADFPERIRRITGISEEMLRDAPPLAAVWDELASRLAAVDGWVAHYAQFERRFLEGARKRFGAPSELPPAICTHRIAERLYPGLPRHGLRAVAGFLGHPLEEPNRAASHVRATLRMWRRFRRELVDREGVATANELESYLQRPPPDEESATYALDRERRLDLPRRPGVYRLLDADAETLYVGRATSLKRRVNQYFQTRRGLSGRKRELVAQVHEVQIEPTATVLEAATAEVDAIKSESPPYNEMLREKPASIECISVPGSMERPKRPPHDRIPIRVGERSRLFFDLAKDFEVSDAIAGRLRLEPERAEEVVDDFRRLHALDVQPGPLRLARLGLELWPPPDREPEAEPTPLERLASIVRGGAAELRLGVWLQHLSGAALAWRARTGPAGDAVCRFVGLDGPELHRAEDVDDLREGGRLALEWNVEPTLVESRDAYDRLRVLSTGLRRICAEERPVFVAVPDGARIRRPDLDRLLDLV